MTHEKTAYSDTIHTKFMNTSAALTWVAFIFAMLLSFCGTFLNHLYNDNPFVKAVWRGNDVVTLAIAAPMMLVFMLRSRHDPVARKGSFLVWMGCLWYMIYNYVFYIYGAAFNIFFLGYAVIIVASSLSLLHGLMAVQGAVTRLVPDQLLKGSYKGVSRFLFVFAFLLGGAWVAMASSYLFTGVVPAAITQTGHPTGVVFATDLIFLVTPLFVLGYYLRIPKRWAILLTPMIMVKCCLYPFVFIVAGLFAYAETGAYDVLTPAYLLLGAGAGVCLRLLLKKISQKTR